MKRFLLTVLMGLFAVAAFAQAPQIMSYQAIVRDGNNVLVRNQAVGVRVSILQGSATGTMVYQETHSAMSNTNGLVTLGIGSGTVVSGDLATIDWGNGPFFLKSEFDPAGGTSYVSAGTEQMTSVPFALYARTAGGQVQSDWNATSGAAVILNKPTIPAEQVQSNWDETDATAKSYIQNKPTIPTVPTNVGAFTNDANYITIDDVPAESQTLADVLTLGNDGGAKQVKNIADPTDDQDAVTKKYLEAQIAALLQRIEELEDNAHTTEQAIITTADITDITGTTATGGGNVADNGGAAVTERGICWSTSQTPTVSDEHMAAGEGMGEFTANMTGLALNTTYYVRAYATNASGTAYGNEVAFSTQGVPTVVTTSVSVDGSAVGDITSDGGSTITRRGFVFGSTEELTYETSFSFSEETDQTGSFNISIALMDGQTNYVRAFATNSYGTAYGEAVSVTAPLAGFRCTGLEQVSDHEGNAYNTVKIGNQCWTKENMRCTTSPSGTAWNNTMSGNTPAFVQSAAQLFNNTSATWGSVGFNECYYNWAAAMDMEAAPSSAQPDQPVRGICPEGWHIPSSNEWLSLKSCLESTSAYQCGGNSTQTAKSLASNLGWKINWTNYASFNGCAVSKNIESSNATGFSFYPMGKILSGTNVTEPGMTAAMWLSTNGTSQKANHASIGMKAITLGASTQGMWSVGMSVRCLKDMATTGEVSDVQQTSAKVSGSVFQMDEAVTARGICYGTEPEPTTASAVAADDNEFEVELTGLTANTTYYVRAYVQYGSEVVYGAEKSFTTEEATAPEVTTVDATEIQFSSATFNGAVPSNGGDAITEHGFYYSTQPFTTDDLSAATQLVVPGTDAPFSAEISCLRDTTTYYYYAYATNDVGTTYGEMQSFTTLRAGIPCPGTPTVTDHEGNVYNTVQIGMQCWTKENMRCATSPNGNFTARNAADVHETYYTPLALSNDVVIDGETFTEYYYNFAAAIDYMPASNQEFYLDMNYPHRGICPEGWHVPSDVEWVILKSYLNSNYAGEAAKAISYPVGWNSNATSGNVGADPCSNNTTGYTALPLGYGGFHTGEGVYKFYNANNSATFWSSSFRNPNGIVLQEQWFSSSRDLTVSSGVSLYYINSVRCIKDESSEAEVPTLTTKDVTDITYTGAKTGGEITSSGTAIVTSRGVCYGTSPNPTIDGLHTSDGVNDGEFVSTLANLMRGTTYYVRAYATNSGGTAYGNEIIFTTPDIATSARVGNPCPGLATVTDLESNSNSNTYNTIQIGNQCWTRENIRRTSSPRGLTLLDKPCPQVTEPYFAHYVGTGIDEYHYNWAAAMDLTDDELPSTAVFVRGICPEGWHIPSEAEFNTMLNTVKSVPEFRCSGTTNNIAKALASCVGWSGTGSNDCYPVKSQETNNLTGFTAVPAGYSGGGVNAPSYSFSEGGQSAYFWTCTPSIPNVRSLKLSRTAATASFVPRSAYAAVTVRCLKDMATTGEVSDVQQTSAKVSGSVFQMDEAVTARGICYGTEPEPTTASAVAADDNEFEVELTGLTANTTYYVRAYVQYGSEVVYGAEKSFTTMSVPATAPEVATKTAINTTTSSATLRGEVISDGGAEITERGFVYSRNDVSTEPAINDGVSTKVAVDGTAGEFSANVTGLSGTVLYNYYSVRAYAINSEGVTYGERWQFRVYKADNYRTPEVTISNNEPSIYILHADGKEVAVSSAIKADGGHEVTDRGFFWKYITPDEPSSAVTWDNNDHIEHISMDPMVREFSMSIPAPPTGQALVVLAFAVNSEGRTITSNRVHIMAIAPGTVSTGDVTAVQSETAEASLTITNTGQQVGSDGDKVPYAMGLCWNTTGNPTISDSHSTRNASTAVNSQVSAYMSGLAPNTTYYYRAYYTNLAGTVYGAEKSFTTTAAITCPASVTDIDNNEYPVVKIGSQCWMAENLRVTSFADATPLSLGLKASSDASYTDSKYYYPNEAEENVAVYGLLYNYAAATHGEAPSNTIPSGVQGICPEGWHLPSAAEYQILYASVGGISVASEPLKSTAFWVNANGTNASGFNAVPAGNYNVGGFGLFGKTAYFWCASKANTSNSNNADNQYLGENLNATSNSGNQRSGYSVRCIKD